MFVVVFHRDTLIKVFVESVMLDNGENFYPDVDGIINNLASHGLWE